jgi:putative ABC transport system permease protein
MSLLKQIGHVVSTNLRSLPQRYATSLVVVIGITGVVAVLIAVLSLSTGLTHALSATGRPDRAIVLHAQSNSEVGSSLPHDWVPTILDAPGILRGKDRKPIASAEMLASVNVPRRDNGLLGTLTLRGVSPNVFDLRPEGRLVDGRMFRPGLREVIAGRATQSRFKGLDVGDHVKFGDSEWTVVGAFDSGGGAHDSELFGDLETVLSAYNRTSLNSVTVKLAGPGAYDQLKASLSKDPTLSVIVNKEPEYYERQSQTFARFLTVIAHFVGGIMAMGAIFAALNTMYSAVSTRTVEIATLRAIGFGSSAVVISVLVEALLLALVGAIIGAFLAWLFFNGNTVSTVSGGGGIAQIAFKLRIGPELIATGMVWACVVGLIGGLLPAVRAGRLPVATALRAV